MRMRLWRFLSFILMLDPADEQYSEEIETPRKKNRFFLHDRLSIYLIRVFYGIMGSILKQSNIFTGGSFVPCLMDCLMIRKYKQRIMYRGIDLSTVKDKEEKKRIARIQRAIRLPAEQFIRL